MKTANPQSTRQKLLEAASIVFVLNGYLGATTNEICSRADANVASVCYHFGGKLNLYREVWLLLCQREIDGIKKLLTPKMTPEERLVSIIRYNIAKGLSSDIHDNLFQLLVYREFSTPSPIMNELLEKYISPSREAYVEILEAYMGRKCSPELINQCFLCIKSAIFWIIDLKVRKSDHNTQLLANFSSTSPEGDLAENLMAYAMGGIKAIKERIS